MRIALSLLLAAATTVTLAAHEGEAAPAFSPSGWDVLVLAALLVSGALYAIGSVRLARRGARVRRLERVTFWGGWAALVAAVAPPLDQAASVSFAMHMAQHELLMRIGAPLFIVGRPLVPWLWALPASVRTRAGGGLQQPLVSRAWRWATAPLVAWALHGVAIWVWHVPVLYEAAVRSEGVHTVQHATFVGTAVLFWWGLVYGRYGRAAYGASMFYVFLTMLHTGVLGAVFALSTSPFYGVYRDRAGSAGLDPVADQQVAGFIAWIPAGVVLTACGLALLVAWLAESARRDRSALHLVSHDASR